MDLSFILSQISNLIFYRFAITVATRTALIFTAIIVLSLGSGCKSDTILLTPPTGPGNGVSFSADVDPIFQATCSGSGCHIGQTTNGVNLSTYNSVIGSVGLSYGTKVVLPSDAAGSPLIDKLAPAPQFGSRMPRGQPSLSPLQIAIIREWIDDGASDN